MDNAAAAPDGANLVDRLIQLTGLVGFDSNGSDFDILREALFATEGLDIVDQADVDFILFAPTDAAFAGLAEDFGFEGDTADEGDIYDFLLDATGYYSPKDPGLLQDLLLYHMVYGTRTATELAEEGPKLTEQGNTLLVDGNTIIDMADAFDDPQFIDGRTDIEAPNGIIHVIDGVLLFDNVEPVRGDVVIDFETDGEGNALFAGDVIDDEFFNEFGLTISTADVSSRKGGPNPAMIFDSNNPTGGDSDLATDGQNNILIISEDNDSSDPDDNGRGGTFVFEFDNAVDVNGLTFIDAESGAVVSAFGEGGVLLDEVRVNKMADGEVLAVEFDFDDVATLTVKSGGSFAVDDLLIDTLGDGGKHDDHGHHYA